MIENIFRRWPARRLAVMAVLLVLPAALYWKTIFHRYGFRDDYSTLREANFEPGKVFDFCIRQARPVYGLIMQWSFAWADGIDDLRWLRLLTAGLLGVLAIGTFLVLRALRWEFWTSALVGAVLVILPSAQVELSWAAIWPHVPALLLALLAFACAETGMPDEPGPLRWEWCIAGLLLVTASALTYQASTPFYIVLTAAAVWDRRGRPEMQTAVWAAKHAALFVGGMILAYVPMIIVFANGWAASSSRVAIERHWLEKMIWFVTEPLQNALALVVIADMRVDSMVFHAAAAVTALVLLAGVVHRSKKQGLRSGLFWAGCIGALLVASYGVSLLVAERWSSYRTLVPLSAMVLILVAASLLELGGPRLARWVLLTVLVVGAWLARKQTFELFARPQAAELALMEEGAARVDAAVRPSVYVIASNVQFTPVRQLFGDEFGSLSTDSEWTPHEMLKLLMWSRHPQTKDVESIFRYESGGEPPLPGRFDVVIDMRQIQDAGPR